MEKKKGNCGIGMRGGENVESLTRGHEMSVKHGKWVLEIYGVILHI